MSRIKYSTIPGNLYAFGSAVKMITIFTSLYRFNAFRNDDGQLNVNVNKTNLDNEWNAGNGACFRNNIFLLNYFGEFCFQGLSSIHQAYGLLRLIE